MHLKIVHTTGYEYDEPVTASFNEARLTAQTQPSQFVTQVRLDVTPKPWSFGYRDHWGSQVTSFEVQEAHSSLNVVATTVVHTNPPYPFVDALTWADLERVTDEYAEFLMILDRARPPAELLDLVLPIRESAATPAEAVRKICALIHREVEYVPGSTHVHAHAADAWEQRKGVCQDIAHLAIGCLRSLGIPTRYVSGYLHPNREPEVDLTVAGESHAWIEWWDGGWRGYDPTNATVPGERYVVVATGRNYDDVRPLSGVYTGGGVESHMFVTVEITRLP